MHDFTEWAFNEKANNEIEYIFEQLKNTKWSVMNDERRKGKKPKPPISSGVFFQ